jgi:hypothetical protein
MVWRQCANDSHVLNLFQAAETAQANQAQAAAALD